MVATPAPGGYVAYENSIGDWKWEPIEAGSIRPSAARGAPDSDVEAQRLFREFRSRCQTHSYQYATAKETRDFMLWQEESHAEVLSDADIDYIFCKEGAAAAPGARNGTEFKAYENSMMRVEVPVIDGREGKPSAEEAKWFIKTGRMVTLTDVFRSGHT